MDILIKILSYIGAFLGGVAVTFGQGWVTDRFKQKEATRNKIEEIVHKITDTLSIAKSSRFRDSINMPRLIMSASQLERLGKKNLSNKIRVFTSKWVEYREMFTSDWKLKIRYGDKKDVSDKLLTDMDNLTDEIIYS